ncbi:type 4b pilus protein PilO2 [Pseudomonas sp. MSSRFD41]|uniref:type 4b pilus protein PilO2 n=1 Tax=Pseudomonas sp. MSSRFD41 TaxID=1310370 RepID=UPI0016397690|nr:type 4b pilus protein PilO2 [Pseudomonas sp. MSSRFD41]MBC2658115.1 type 4b pilus protein PilO2 [Pseudomonas sp. MSSRFD41]
MSSEAPAPKTTRSRVQLLSHGGYTFVTGLRWQPLDSVTGYMKEARQFGKENQLDIVTIRRSTRTIQAGFVSRNDGVTKGMYSLASTLAGQLGESWVAAWRVSDEDDRFAVVAVHDGGVIPGCDVMGTEAEVRKRVSQQRSRGIEFEAWYLPTEFGMGGTPLDVEELLHPSKLKREYRLRPLVFGLSKAEILQLSIIGLLIGGAFIGWLQWNAHKQRIAQEALIEAEKRRLADLEKLQAETGTQQPAQALDHPWATLPSVTTFIQGCSEVLYQLPLNISGWSFADAQCDGNQVLASYKRTGNSTAAELINASKGYFSDHPAFFDEGSSATLQFSLSLPAAGDEPLIDAIDALADLSTWLHRFSQEPKLKEVPVVVPQQPALPGQPAPPPPPPPQWKQFQLDVVSGVLPYDALGDAPSQGLRLREIKTEYKAGHLMWSVKGDLYAK